MARTTVDVYDKEISVGDKIVFSWGGDLRKAVVEQIKMGRYYNSLIVRPLYDDDSVYPNTAKVKNAKSCVKI